MSVYAGPEIVNDGLVLCLDAGNTKSYPGSGTAWTDLSGRGNNGTLTNGPTFDSANGGSITFDGSDDYASVGGSSIITTSATFLIWLYSNGIQNDYDGFFFARGVSVTGMNITSSNQLGYHWNDSVSTYGWNSNLTIPNSAWCMCAISVTASSAIAYLGTSSGITSNTNSVSHASTTISSLQIGRDPTLNRYFTGNISQACLYNRALSSSEIEQNFSALRGRFGI